jgi:hypothetical protein
MGAETKGAAPAAQLDAATLAELQAEARADSAPGQAAEAPAAPAPAVDPAEEQAAQIRTALKMGRDFGAATRFPSLALEVTDELIEGVAVPGGLVCAKYGVNLGLWLKDYAAELALAWGAIALMRAINRALRADVQPSKPKPDAAAPAASGRGDGTLAPV